jgi:hypothetical protein
MREKRGKYKFQNVISIMMFKCTLMKEKGEKMWKYAKGLIGLADVQLLELR